MLCPWPNEDFLCLLHLQLLPAGSYASYSGQTGESLVPPLGAVTGYSSPPIFTRLGACPNYLSLDSSPEPLDRPLRAPSHICPCEHGTIAQFSTSISSSARSASQLKRVLETDRTEINRRNPRPL